jgi:hypothetical protein
VVARLRGTEHKAEEKLWKKQSMSAARAVPDSFAPTTQIL